MDSLPINTKHRLQRIPQVPHIWEGDRLPVAGVMDNLEPDLVENGECIIWVDGSEGFVRSMEVVRSSTGLEAMVRSLLKAIETPHSPAQPARPQKIVVKNRELQFFLRGALQGLDIQVDYKAELPLLDELWNNFQSINQASTNEIRPELMTNLKEVALTQIWEQQPWEILAESDILKIEFDNSTKNTIYACIMGMMGQEFGVILYRSWDSLKKFRQLALDVADDASEIEIESAFLNQDCWFVNFAPFEDEDNEEMNINASVVFGSIHPYEGIRPLRDEEELMNVSCALQALGLFVDQYESELDKEIISALSQDYSISPLLGKKEVKVTVSSVPELTAELEQMLDDYEYDYFDDDDDDDDDFVLSDDLIPQGSIVSFAILSADLFNNIYGKHSIYIDEEGLEDLIPNLEKHGIPTLLIQTTRPKAKILIEQLKEEEGITNIVFNKGSDPELEIDFNLGIIQTGIGNFYLCYQYPKSHTSFEKGLAKWKKQVSLSKNHCAFIVAMGVTGASKGNPSPKDILALFPAKYVKPEDIGLPELVYD